MKTIFLGLLGAVLLSAAVAARSTPITYQFVVTGGGSGPLAHQTATGSFTYNSSIIPVGGGVVDQSGLFSAFLFTWDGISYNQTTANTSQLAFDSEGTLIGVQFGSNCNSAYCSIGYGTSEWIFQWYPNNRNFYYELPAAGGIGYGGIAEIPALEPLASEPGTVGLLGAGIAALVLAAGRRKYYSKRFPFSQV